MSYDALPSADISLREDIPPQWDHPFLRHKEKLTLKELQSYAYDYYMRFLPLFRSTPQGSIRAGVEIAFTKRMKNQLGNASVYLGLIKLNRNYFEEFPSLLPYTLFHELTHVWLYDCGFDPGHTKRFYLKMAEFDKTRLPIDPSVHIHKRIQSEGQYVYRCGICERRWYSRKRHRRTYYCGPCYEENGVQSYMNVSKNQLTL